MSNTLVCASWQPGAPRCDHVGECADCHEPVAISPEGRAFLAGHDGARVLCIACAVATAPPGEVPLPVPGAFERYQRTPGANLTKFGQLVQEGRPMRDFGDSGVS